jgi:sialate O-acetylesterase
LSASHNGGSVIVHFDKPVLSYGGSPVGFELCAETEASCRYVLARVEGSVVVIDEKGIAATRVRYAWADYPIVNLYGPERLPVPPFELPISN